MKRRSVYLALLLTVSCVTGQESSCWFLDEPTPLPTPTPIVVPSPTPTPSPTPVVLNCRVDFLRVSGPSQLLKGESARYDLTPMQIVNGVTLQVPDPCNEPLATSVEWRTLDPLVGVAIGNGFAATVTRLVPTTPIVLRVEFKGVFTERVIL